MTKDNKPEDYRFSGDQNYILMGHSILHVVIGFMGSDMIDLIIVAPSRSGA